MTHHKEWPECEGSKPGWEKPRQVLGNGSHGGLCVSGALLFPKLISCGSQQDLSDRSGTE